MLSSSVPVLVLALLSVATAASSNAASDPDSVRLLHRIYHPSRPSEPFTDRATLLLHRRSSSQNNAAPITSASLVPSESLQADVANLQLAFQAVLDDLTDREGALSPTKASQEILYQLAMEHPGDAHHSQWHVSSVKAVSLFSFFSLTSLCSPPSLSGVFSRVLCPSPVSVLGRVQLVRSLSRRA